MATTTEFELGSIDMKKRHTILFTHPAFKRFKTSKQASKRQRKTETWDDNFGDISFPGMDCTKGTHAYVE